jgi:CopG-like RHH_1 or ribbon-helix-helix domain, RHH_5
MANKRYWRINPTPFVEQNVERMAREESRSLSNMMDVLLKQAIHARVAREFQEQQRSTEHDALVRTIRGEPT